jgi:hypothetical protein
VPVEFDGRAYDGAEDRDHHDDAAEAGKLSEKTVIGNW